MKIAIIGYGDANTASHRFRFQAYETILRQDGHEFIYIYKKDINDQKFWDSLEMADIIINQKCLLPKKLGTKIFSLNTPVFFDFDDAIWTRPKKAYSWITQKKINARFQYWLKEAKGVLVANSFLAENAAKYSSNIHIIPMALDLEMWKPSKIKSTSTIIGWNGSPNNLNLLKDISQPIKDFKGNHPNTTISILSGKKPTLPYPFNYTPYADGSEVSFIQQLSIGLLPLENNTYAQGKSPIKALQYLACGVPIIGNINAGGKDFLNETTCYRIKDISDWVDGLTILKNDMNTRKNHIKSGLKIIEENHSTKKVFQSFKQAIGL